MIYYLITQVFGDKLGELLQLNAVACIANRIVHDLICEMRGKGENERYDKFKSIQNALKKHPTWKRTKKSNR